MDPYGEERAEYVRVMGSELGPLCHELQDDFGWLRHKWREFEELFGKGGERVELLNSVASNFFYFLNKVFFEDAILHLCRLTDPPRSAGRDTLSILSLVDLISDATLKACVKTKAELAQNSCGFAREWRNQKLAHTDLWTLRNGRASTLQSVTAKDIENAIKSIRDVLNSVEDHYSRPHSIPGPDPWGSKSLIHYLERSVRREKIE